MNSGFHSVGQAMVELNKAATETNSMAQSIAELSTSLKSESGGLAETVMNLNRLVLGEISNNLVDIEAQEQNSEPEDFDSSAA